MKHRLIGILIGVLIAISFEAASQQIYNYFSPGGALSCTSPCTSQNVNLSSGASILGNLPLTNLASIANNTIVANASGSAASGSATNPLAIAIMMSAVLAVDVVATTNITLSGAQTIDGVSVGSGQTVLKATNSVDAGIYVSASGAWVRAVNFPTGYVVAQNCDLIVKIRNGTINSGLSYFLATSSGTITIGTTSQTWSQVAETASATKLGKVQLAGANGNAQTVVSSGAGGGNDNDCVSFLTYASGLIDDTGNAFQGAKGGCMVESLTSGFIILDGSKPTASAGTIDTNSKPNAGRVTGLSGATTLTITFNQTLPYAPFCLAGDSAGTVVTTSSTTTTTAVFTMTALTGTLTYHCF